MRLKSHIFVASLIRSVFVRGGYAAVLRKGAEEAGAIFIRQRGRSGYETLYAPAPQNFFDDEGDTSRRFEVRLRGAEAEDVERALSSEIRFDPDCWIVELELDDCGNLFDVVDDRG
ncbi:DUF1491 family protein [Sinorhizobium medicae]|uniref:DUF1491 family protein n=1 Tax=Sinorhizobium medicae TaxID=110321 RepID=UPI0003708C2F|nr:DUF1491 family protein [Sinorhizobium medicae]RVQ76534.1 DUF1491 family protein [Sinorhizobium medicae]WQO46484.1 DUF1491 family protein [Sinorhizobium medicae]WQO66611.1 DUF1491 family protein [Sinorhizobium medicae]WQO73748.1 DUF1491 family protein [Sinorhizobium medicae]WQO93092.1 DUF1491 family protein [Sinorhizobium medicae]